MQEVAMTIAHNDPVIEAWVNAAGWAALWPVSLFTAWVLFACPAGRSHHAGKHRHHDLEVPEPVGHAREQDLFA
jgi:hypothetical protein